MSPANMEHIPGLDRWLTTDPRDTGVDCACADWQEDCCGFCNGEDEHAPGTCKCDEAKHWRLIAEAHYDECPTAIAAKAQRKSTLCACKQLAAAELAAKSEQFCERCHTWAPDCRCPEEKRQWV